MLEGWWQRHRGHGLVAIGMYHHKAKAPFDRAHVEAHAKHLGFTFPVATDSDWRTLRAWWLDGRDGKVLHVHRGGTIDPADDDGKALEKALTVALQ